MCIPGNQAGLQLLTLSSSCATTSTFDLKIPANAQHYCEEKDSQMKSTAVKPRKKKFKTHKDGGLEYLEKILRLRTCEEALKPALDVIFISIDIEMSLNDRRKLSQNNVLPPLREIGLSFLDIRLLLRTASDTSIGNLISTRQFSTSNASKDFEKCDGTNFKECLFAETKYISPANIGTRISNVLHIRDELSVDGEQLRRIVLVGHSLASDLRVLDRYGVDFYKIAPIQTCIDTFRLSQDILGPKSSIPLLNGATPLRRFHLFNLLRELQIPYKTGDLHNAGNDANFTLHAMLHLVLRSSRSRDLSPKETQMLAGLHVAMQKEALHGKRYTPVRAGSFGLKVKGEQEKAILLDYLSKP